MITGEISQWIVLIIVIGLVILLIKAGIKILNIVITALILLFCWYSFFTEEGAVRLSIVLTGHPVLAYTTKLTKMTGLSTEEVKYYKTDKDIVVNGQTREYMKCNTKWIIKVPVVEE